MCQAAKFDREQVTAKKNTTRNCSSFRQVLRKKQNQQFSTNAKFWRQKWERKRWQQIAPFIFTSLRVPPFNPLSHSCETQELFPSIARRWLGEISSALVLEVVSSTTFWDLQISLPITKPPFCLHFELFTLITLTKGFQSPSLCRKQAICRRQKQILQLLHTLASPTALLRAADFSQFCNFFL